MIFPAATVLVLRDSREGPEVFMVRRHGKSSFMANAWVYPGGKVDEADSRPEVLARVIGEPRLDAGFYLAAIRETFEEAGFLLARRRGEAAWIDLHGSPRFVDYRAALQRGEESLSRVAELEDLEFALDELAWFAHWITPTFEPKRFDTHFFVARAPTRQTPLHDARETTDSFWTRPGDVLTKFRAGELYLAPPTERTLERVAACDTVDTVFATTRDFTPPCIIPHLVHADDGPLLLLPGDPDYPADDPAYVRATAVDGETRMRLAIPS